MVPLFFALVFLTPVAILTALTATAIDWLQTNYPNGLPSSDWEAIAGTIGIVGATGDFLMWIVAGAVKASSIPGSSYAAMAVAIMMDLIVLFMSLLSWSGSNPVIAILALSFATLAFFITVASQRSLVGSLSPYGKFSTVLAGVGVGAAAADVLAA